MNNVDCISEGYRQLSSPQLYESMNTNLTSEIIQRISLYTHDMLQRGQITEKTCSCLTTSIDRTQKFYMLPAIHKNFENLHGRSVVLGSGGPTEKITQFVDHFIGPLVN